MATLAELQSDLALAEQARRTLLTGAPLARLTVGGVDKTFFSLDQIDRVIRGLKQEISDATLVETGGSLYNYGAFRRAS